MKALILISFLISVLSAQAGPVPAATPRKVTLVTHEYPPFMSQNMPDQGSAIYALRKVLKKMHYDLNAVIVSSWERAKNMALTDLSMDGYFPYATIENKNVFAFSDGFSTGTWSIIERKSHPIHWEKFEDLGKYLGGNVVGVELRPGIKELVEQKKLSVDESTPDNVAMLLNLAKKHVDYAFMNPMSFKYEMAVNEALRPFRKTLQINPKPIATNHYGVAFRRTRFDEEFMKEFNKYSKNVDSYQLEYFERLAKEKK